MATPSSSRPRGQWVRSLRRYHRLIGLFFTPAILFFSITGALQTLEFHDARQGAVSAWLTNAASLHKHQRLSKPKPSAGNAAPSSSASASASPAPREHPALRLFVVLMAIALAGSALSGCVIALQMRATRREAVAALIAGIVVPVILYAL